MDATTSLADLVRSDSRRRGLGRLLGRLVDRPGGGTRFARAMRAPLAVTRLSGPVTRGHAWMLARSGGRTRRSWLFTAGQPVLSLTTRGRRSGRPRTTAVACFVDGDDLVLAAMNLGRPVDPHWARNLTAEPRASIVCRGQVIAVRARPVDGAEHARLWARWCEVQPSAPAFRALAGREIPLFVLTRDDAGRYETGG